MKDNLTKPDKVINVDLKIKKNRLGTFRNRIKEKQNAKVKKKLQRKTD